MYALLGNMKGKVKPWYLPFDLVFCRVPIKGYVRTRIVKNSSVRNVYGLPVDLVNGVVVGKWEHKPYPHSRKKDIEMTEREVREVIEKISEWLTNGAPGNTIEDPEESAAADLAREFSHELLRAAKADALNGCRLCQGFNGSGL